MPVAGEIKECSGKSWRRIDVYPFDETFSRTSVEGIVSREFDFHPDTRGERVMRKVSWASLGSVTPAEARAFADAIRAAADWAETAELEVANGK